MGLLSELKRRNVIRAGLLYVGVVWALSQGVAQVAPVFDVPNAVVRGLIVAACIGFPFWLAFAWFYEWTPEGFRREREVEPGESITLSTGRKLDFAIIGVLAVAVVLLVTDRFVSHKGADVAAVSEKSIAVLPLVNASGDDKQQFFSDGIAESLIVTLSQAPGLTVIGRNSSFQFRDGKTDSKTVGEKLGVARLLSGSVQHAGDMVRINMELVDAPTGHALWSQSYDRPYADLFKLEDDITAAVADVLQAKLLGDAATAQSDRPPSGNLAAYNAYLEANFQIAKASKDGNEQAIPLLDRAIAFDPGYALAYAKRAIAKTNLVLFSDAIGAKRIEAGEPARADVQRALTLNPQLAYAHAAAGFLADIVDADSVAAEAAHRHALALQPELPIALNGMADQMMLAGRYPEAIDLTRRAVQSDPLRIQTYIRLGNLLLLTGQLDEAQAVTDKTLAIQPTAPGPKTNLATLAILRGDAAAALRAAQAVPPDRGRDGLLAAAAQIAADRSAADTALHGYIDQHNADDPTGIAELYALRNEPDQAFDWLQRALAAGDPSAKGLWGDFYLTRYRNDPHFTAFCKQAGIPTPADVDVANATYLAKRASAADAP